LLNARGTQTGKAMLVDRELPGQEFIDSQRITAAGFLKREETTANSGDNLGLTSDDPTFGTGRWKSAIVNGLPSGPMTYLTLGRWGSVMVYSQTRNNN